MIFRCGALLLSLALFGSGCANTDTIPAGPPQATFDFSINSDPPGANIVMNGQSIGSTPLRIPVEIFAKGKWDWIELWEKSVFTANIPRPLPTPWQTSFRFSLNKDGHYGMDVDYPWGRFVSPAWERIKTSWDETALKTRYIDIFRAVGSASHTFVLPIKAKEFAENLGSLIRTKDFYGAEELRVRRITTLGDLLRSDCKSRDCSHGSIEVYLDPVESQLMRAEIDRLVHLVGLLDPQLMMMRDQLAAKLRDEDLEAAYRLAEAIAAMEMKYFPEPQPVVVVQSPESSAAQGSMETARIVVQQKPYYGATHIINSITAMKSKQISAEEYRKAYGAAQLLDILGFSDWLNK